MTGRRTRRSAARAIGVLLTGALLLTACGEDEEDASPAPGDTTTTETTVPVPEEAPLRRIADDCPPVGEPIDIPAEWPGEPIEAVAGADPVEIDLSIAIDAECIVIAATYAAALPVATPNLGTIEVVDGSTVAFRPPSPPADPARPELPWWGEDRVRACTNVGNGRLACTNLDIDVWRADVVTLADAFATSTRPRLLSPLTRGDSNGNGTSNAGLARLQDAFGATWALSLLADTLAERTAPRTVEEACVARGVDPEALWPAAQQLVDRFASLVDITSVELTTVTGGEPSEDLAAASNDALGAVAAWARCEVT